MSSFQVTACKPAFNVLSIPHGQYASSGLHAFIRFSKNSACHFTKVPEVSCRLRTCTSGIQRCAPVYAFGGKGNSTNDNDVRKLLMDIYLYLLLFIYSYNSLIKDSND